MWWEGQSAPSTSHLCTPPLKNTNSCTRTGKGGCSTPAMMHVDANSPDPVVVQEERLEPAQQRESIQFAYLIVGKINGVKLILWRDIHTSKQR